MKTLILLLTKGPHRYRLGPKHLHDWVRSCERALAIREREPGSEIYVASAVHVTGFPSEFELYKAEFLRRGLRVNEEKPCFCILHDEQGPAVTLSRTGYETIGQIGLALEMAEIGHAERVVIVSTIMHFLRVRYLCRRIKAAHTVAWGIPNLTEACTDPILAALFPVLNLMGLRRQFQEWTVRHRKSGKHI